AAAAARTRRAYRSPAAAGLTRRNRASDRRDQPDECRATPRCRRRDRRAVPDGGDVDRARRSRSRRTRPARSGKRGIPEVCRAPGSAGGGLVAERVAEFAQAAREAVTSGIAVNQPALFAAELRKAGEVLSTSGTGDEVATAAALAAVTLGVRRLAGVEPTPPQ